MFQARPVFYSSDHGSQLPISPMVSDAHPSTFRASDVTHRRSQALQTPLFGAFIIGGVSSVSVSEYDPEHLMSKLCGTPVINELVAVAAAAAATAWQWWWRWEAILGRSNSKRQRVNLFQHLEDVDLIGLNTLLDPFLLLVSCSGAAFYWAISYWPSISSLLEPSRLPGISRRQASSQLAFSPPLVPFLLFLSFENLKKVEKMNSNSNPWSEEEPARHSPGRPWLRRLPVSLSVSRVQSLLFFSLDKNPYQSRLASQDSEF
ncbi:Uncharacterized protein Adt_04957 [Abeliophyllum distichum]|uniref:Uncharacterized protein n=1 Tax=Abeliophyllum distichum TaxID=126358 RepID=A0ABD1V356_9LAMI